MATTKKMTASAGYHECSRCHERIAVGSYYVREGARFTHSSECAPVAASAPSALSAAPVAPAARTNLYAARCACCGREVAAGSGVLSSRFDDDVERTVWTVRHADESECAGWLDSDRAVAAAIYAHDVATRSND